MHSELLVENELDWFELTDAIENNRLIAWKDYFIARHYNLLVPTAFLIFTLNEKSEEAGRRPRLKGDPDSNHKLHVALNDIALEIEIKKAFIPLLEVLHNNKIDCFKVIRADKYCEFVESGQVGKIFTVYLNHDAKPGDLERIAAEIDAALINAGCEKPETLATACVDRRDEVIDGCQFVTLAEPRNSSLTRYTLFPSNPASELPSAPEESEAKDAHLAFKS